MSWDSLIGNRRAKTALQMTLAENRLGHALIFSGPGGVGKRQFALTLAKAVNCDQAEADSCDHCPVCRKIDAGDHVDVALVQPDGAFIRVRQVRQIVQQAYYRPFESGKRVFILDPAEAMNAQAANALLKTLEEPPKTTILILITEKLHSLLPTVRSRCQICRFRPLKIEEVESFLQSYARRPQAEVKLLARLSAGCIGRALEIDLSIYETQRKEMLEVLRLLIESNHQTRLIKAAEYLGKKLSREEFEKRLDLLVILLRDLVTLIIQGDSAQVTNIDVVSTLSRLAKQWSLEKIGRLGAEVETLRRNLRQNIHRQIALEEIFLGE